MLIVIIFTISGIVFLILRDTTNVTGNRFTETYNAMGPTATGDYLSSFNEERRHIASPSATGNLRRSTQGYICNICRVARTVKNKNYLT